jgi:hypothetical protein
MSFSKKAMGIMVCLALMASALVYFLAQPSAQSTAVFGNLDSEKSTPNRDNIPPPVAFTQEEQLDPSKDETVAEFARLLRERFANEIDSIAVQAGLKDFREGLKRDYPGQGAELFEKVLRSAFPNMADEILLTIANMDLYDSWLVDNYLDLSEKNPMEREGTIWAKRVEIFGEKAAHEIWHEDIAQDQQREQTVKTVINELNSAYDMPLQDRVYTLNAVMQEQYGGTAAGLTVGTTSLTSQLIFEMDSVQKELSEMEPEARQEAINQVRRQLGYPEERIAVLAEQDTKKDDMWNKGNAYMQERQALIESYQGNDLETELDLLRLKHFNDRHAYSIKQEESIGMMRYERPRVYGRN